MNQNYFPKHTNTSAIAPLKKMVVFFLLVLFPSQAMAADLLDMLLRVQLVGCGGIFRINAESPDGTADGITRSAGTNIPRARLLWQSGNPPSNLIFIGKPQLDPSGKMMEEAKARPFAEFNFSLADEREFFRTQDPTATDFSFTRDPILDNLTTLFRFLWGHYGLPFNEAVIEVGSGSTGVGFERYRPPAIADWLQVELNPRAIAAYKQRSPEARVQEGSYYTMPSQFQNTGVIVGVSSLDAVDIRRALEGVAQTLRPGGFAFFFQDVMPGVRGVLQYLRDRFGREPDKVFVVKTVDRGSKDIVIGFEIDGLAMSLPELFRQAIGYYSSQNPAWTLVANDYHNMIDVEPGSRQLHAHSFGRHVVWLRNSEEISKAVPGIKEVSVLLTVLKKK